MTNEYFDVLDENGNKTNIVKSRTEVHSTGLWHKTAHIWVINDKNEILLQRRCATKDSNPNMLDISCAGHLNAGETSIVGALRELKEELNLEVNPQELQFIKTFKKSSIISNSFINNEFVDLYILKTNKSASEMKFQESEISEIFYVPFNDFKNMVTNNHPELLRHDVEFNILFSLF